MPHIFIIYHLRYVCYMSPMFIICHLYSPCVITGYNMLIIWHICPTDHLYLRYIHHVTYVHILTYVFDICSPNVDYIHHLSPISTICDLRLRYVHHMSSCSDIFTIYYLYVLYITYVHCMSPLSSQFDI